MPAQPTRKGKPCGKSFIPRAHKCREGAASLKGPAFPSSGGLAVGAALTGAGLLALALTSRRHWSPEVDTQFAEALAYNKEWDVYKRKLQVDRIAPDALRERVGRDALRKLMCGSPRGDADMRIDAYRDCALQIGETSAYGKVILHPSEDFVFKVPTGNIQRNGAIDLDAARTAAENEAENLLYANSNRVPSPAFMGINPTTKVLKMGFLKGYTTLREATGGDVRSKLKNWTVLERRNLRQKLIGAAFTMHKAGQGHADLHLGNIMVSADKKDLAFIDFGIARSPATSTVVGCVAAITRDLSSITRHAVVLSGPTVSNATALQAEIWMQRRNRDFIKSNEAVFMGSAPINYDTFLTGLSKFYGDLFNLTLHIERSQAKAIPRDLVL